MPGPVFNAALTGNWSGFGRALGRLSVQFPIAMEAALREEGEFYRNKMVIGIREQAPGGRPFQPLSPVTLALRKMMGFGGTKALIRTGELRNNIVSVYQKGVCFVGILYTARGEDGRKLADIGKVHEYGGVVRAGISKKRMALIAAVMRKYGGGQRSMGGGAGLGMVRIPARPFIRPVFEMYGGSRGAQRMMARVSRKLGGLLGVINHPDLGGHKVSQMPEKFLGGRAGKATRAVRTGTMGKARARPVKLKGLAFKGIKGRRNAVKLKRTARVRRPQIIRPKVARPRAVRPRKVRAPKIAKPRTPRAPKVRAPKAPRAPTAKQQKASARRQAAHAAAQTKRAAQFAQRAKNQAAAQAKTFRAKARSQLAAQRAKNRSNKKAGKRVGRDFKLRALQARRMKADARRAAKAARADQRMQREMARGHALANKDRKAAQRALQKKQAALYKAEKKAGMHRPHDAHIKAMRAGQQDAHVKARARHQRDQQHDSHVKARRAHRKAEKQAKPKKG